jgi:hypothetical protein
MDLVIEKLEGQPIISLCHYSEQNGDLMRDPELCYYTTDKEAKPNYFRNDYVGVEHATMPDFFGDVPVKPHLQPALDSFSRTWLNNLREQGFFEKAMEMNRAANAQTPSGSEQADAMREESAEAMTFTLAFKWTVSRARDTRGWNVCTLYVDGQKVAQCNGGGYDMEGTVLGDWLANRFADRLRERVKAPMYGLTFHDPDFNPGKALVPDTGKTVEAMKAAGESFGLERYQAVFSASSPVPTETHRVPHLDGACGKASMIELLKAIGGQYTEVETTKNQTTATISVPRTRTAETEVVAGTEESRSLLHARPVSAATTATHSHPEGRTTMSDKQSNTTTAAQEQNGQENARMPPLYELKLAGVQARIDRNETERGIYYSAAVYRTFTGRDGTEKVTYSIREQDIPAATQLLQEAQRRIQAEREQTKENEQQVQVTRNR